MSNKQQQHQQQRGNNFSLLTVDPIVADNDTSSDKNSSSHLLISLQPNFSLSSQHSIDETLKSIQAILHLDKSKLNDQLFFMLDNFKKILHQLMNIVQVKKEHIEFYCQWMRLVKYLCLGGGEKVSYRLGNETDVIPWILYISFDANVMNDQFIDGEIVRMGKYLIF